MRVSVVPRGCSPALLNFGSNPYDTIRGLSATCSTDIAAGQLKKLCLQALDEGVQKSMVVRALSRGIEELFEMAGKYPDVAIQIKFLSPDCFNNILKAIMARPG